jgi:glucose/arabinose dehydrogenase
MKRLAAALVAALALSLVPAPPAGAAVRKIKVASCPNGNRTCWPAAFAFTPDGTEIFWAERFTGRIRRTVLATGATSTWFRLRGVARDGEQGILGLAVDPDWPADGWVYVYFTKRSPLQNRIIRIRSLGGGSFEKDRLLTIPAGSFHNGGMIHFGPDGMLYAVTGDAGRPRRALRKKNEAGCGRARTDPSATMR